MNLQHLRRSLHGLGIRPDARDLSEMLWLGVQLQRVSDEQSTPDGPQDQSDTWPTDTHDTPSHVPIIHDDTAAASVPDADSLDQTSLPEPMRLHSQTATVGVVQERAFEIPVPKALPLSDRLRLQRALRPLRQNMEIGSSNVVDEQRTADLISNQLPPIQIWSPVWQMATERWLDVAIIVDAGDSMLMWRDLSEEFARALAQTGIFRKVSRFRLNHPPSGGCTIESWNGTVHNPASLIDPTGRRVLLVVSDCTGEGWYDGAVTAILRHLGAHCPVAIVQVLPERLWARTAAYTIAGSCRAAYAAAPNTQLHFDPFSGGGPQPGMVVPVFDISAPWIARWSRVLAGGRAQPGSVMLLSDRPLEAASPVVPHEVDPLTRVRRFRSTASREAVQLARYVSLIRSPSLPVIQYIHQAMFRPAHPGSLAELVLSGLLQVVDPQSGQYEFTSDVDRLLVDSLTRTERESMRRLLEERITETLIARASQARKHFTAFASGPGTFFVDSDRSTFAVLNANSLRSLGWSTGDPLTTDTSQAEPPSLSPDQLRQIIELFRPEAHLIPFHGIADLSALIGWCTNPHGPSALLLTGSSGVGKTRLAMMLEAAMKRDGWQIWKPGEPPPAPTREPLLAIIDNPETLRFDAIPSPRPADFPSLRTLAIGRSVGDWWTELRQAWNLTTQPSQITLKQLSSRDGVGFSEHVHRSLVPFLDSPLASIDPAGSYADILFRVLRSALAVSSELAWVSEVVADAYLEHQQHYWERAALVRQLTYASPTELDSYIAAAWLYGAADQTSAARLIELLGPFDAQSAISLARWIRDLYPSATRFWGTASPAEARTRYLARVLVRHPSLITKLLPHQSEDLAPEAVATLVNVSLIVPDLAPVFWQSVATNPKLIAALWDAVPPLLDPAATALRVAIRGTLRDPSTPLDVLAVVSRGLGDQAAMFFDADLRTAEDLLDNYRRLSKARPEHTDRLADALGHVAARRSHYLQQGAIDAAQERCSTLTQLARLAPPGISVRLNHALASSFTSLGEYLEQAGRRESAAVAAARAIDVWNQITAGVPAEIAAMAQELLRLGQLLHRLDDRAASQRSMRAAITLARRLHQTDQNRHFAILVAATIEMARVQWHAGELDGAVEHSSLALGLFIDLPGDRLARHERIHAATWVTHATILSTMGDHAQALGAFIEALTIYRAIPPTSPDYDLAGLAHAHFSLAVQLSEAESNVEAMGELDAAVQVYRRLADFDIPARIGLAMALSHRARIKARMGESVLGRGDLVEAIQIYQRLRLADPANSTVNRQLTVCGQLLAEWVTD